MDTPYTPPQADIEPSPSGGRKDFWVFNRVHTFVVLLLCLFTFGIYNIYWMYTRTKDLNSISKDNPLPQNLVNAYIVITIVNIILSIVVRAGGPLEMAFVSVVISLVGLILYIIWVFGFRNRIHQVANISPSDTYWISGFLTVLFIFLFTLNVVYLNYKINQIRDGAA